MRGFVRGGFAAGFVALAMIVGLAAEALAAGATIFVKDMHCPVCAKKIASKLNTVPGVGSVKTSVKANRAEVTYQTDKEASPKAMWEAVEKAGFHPTKLVGPDGTSYSAKPKS